VLAEGISCIGQCVNPTLKTNLAKFYLGLEYDDFIDYLYIEK